MHPFYHHIIDGFLDEKIAQDVEKVLPELVNQSDPKSVNYDGLIGLLIEAIKEQQEQINILKQEIQSLK
jgi:hypothetical protein